MRIFSGLRRLFSGNATSVEHGEQRTEPDFYSQESAAPVTEDTALQISSVFACTRLISEVFASLPMTMYEKGANRQEVKTHPLVSLFTQSPNSRQTPVEFFETMQLNLVLHGNAYARIERNKRGDVIALWPMPAQHVQTELLLDGSVIHYWYHGIDVTALADSSVLHIRLFGNGLVGLNPLAYARNTVGLAAASENYAAKYFVNGGKPSGVLRSDSALTKIQRDAARESFREIVEQKEESQRLLVLPLGFQYQQIQMSPGDMQMLETRRFQTKDICRFFGNVPPVLIGETQDSTALGSSIEQILIGWYRLGLNPYAVRWQQGIAKKLLKPVERLKFEFKVDFTALTRGDSKTQMEFVKGMVGGPVMVPNEGRKMVNLPPIDGGDRLNPAPTEGRKATDKEVAPNG